MTDPASNTTTYSYDRENDLTDIANALGRHTSFGWYFGRVPGYVSFPSGYVEYYSIDNNFNITDKTDRNGQDSRYADDYQNAAFLHQIVEYVQAPLCGVARNVTSF